MKQKIKIPKTVAQVRVNSKIPDKVAQLLGLDRNYVISFKYYRDNLCEMKLLEKNKPKECLQILKRIGKTQIGKLAESNIDRIPIKNSGEYKKLFHQTTPDVQIFEHKVQNTSRIFYFTSAHEFHIVAITNSHLETEKTRR